MKHLFAAALVTLTAASGLSAQILLGDPGSLDSESSDQIMSNAGAALTPSSFDPETLNTLIEGSDLDSGTKDTLKAAVAKAAENPELVDATLAQVQSALGM